MMHINTDNNNDDVYVPLNQLHNSLSGQEELVSILLLLQIGGMMVDHLSDLLTGKLTQNRCDIAGIGGHQFPDLTLNFRWDSTRNLRNNFLQQSHIN